MPSSFRSGERQFERKEWNILKAFYKNRCVRCGRKESDDLRLTADHVIPLKMGGARNIGNIQPLCESCNKWKGSQIEVKGKILDWRHRRFKN